MQENSKFLQITKQVNPKDFLSTIKQSILSTIERRGKVNRAFEEEKKHDREGEYKARRLLYRFKNLPIEFEYSEDFFRLCMLRLKFMKK
jgi:hypothetical protein